MLCSYFYTITCLFKLDHNRLNPCVWVASSKSHNALTTTLLVLLSQQSSLYFSTRNHSYNFDYFTAINVLCIICVSVLLAISLSLIERWGVGANPLVEHPTETPGAILTQVRVPSAASDSPLPPVNFLCRLSYGIRVQLHASTSVHTLKIPNTASHTIVWTHKNTAHTDRNG